MTLEWTSQLSSVDLAGLPVGAELLCRADRKYQLGLHQASQLIDSLDPDTRVLTILGRRSHRYESVYFDTPDLISYRQAAHARRRRFKVRTRSYLDTGQAFLEVKVNGYRGLTQKERIPQDPATPAHLTEAGRAFAESVLMRHGLDASVIEKMAPTLVTRYRRVTFVPPEPGVRMTIDTDLTWSDGERELALGDLAIVETKSVGHPSGIDRLLWRNGHRPTALSKYGTGLAALQDELPSNRWTQVLRHHFHTTKELTCAA